MRQSMCVGKHAVTQKNTKPASVLQTNRQTNKQTLSPSAGVARLIGLRHCPVFTAHALAAWRCMAR